MMTAPPSPLDLQHPWLKILHLMMSPTQRALYALAGVGTGFAAGRVTTRRSVASSSLSGAFRNGSNDLLLYEPDGRLTSVSHGKSGNVVVASIGRWRLHNASTSFAATYPPHDGEMVEHSINAASDTNLIGRSTVMQYSLTADGELKLATTELREGRSMPTSISTWRRVIFETAA